MISLLGNLDVNNTAIMPLQTGDLICLDSSLSEPRRVTRHQFRLSNQALK
jgi:hypothetical protein